MSNKLNEELSALVDDEASEFGLRKILTEIESESELVNKWSRYHIAQAVLRDEQLADTSFGEGIAAALADEPAHNGGAGQYKPSDKASTGAFLKTLSQPLSSAALAASVTLAAVLSWQEFNPPAALTQEPVIAAIQQVDTPAYSFSVPSSGAVAIQPASAQTTRRAGVGRVVASSSAQNAPAIQAIMPSVAEQRMQVYIISHANYGAVVNGSGMMPFARLVSAGRK